jgi:pilus assembly protein CpaF
MLQAMNTGHDGSLTTLHSNSPRDALNRLETMVAMANLNLPERAIRQHIAGGIDVVIQLARLPDGNRKVMSVSEITGMEGEVISMQDLFVFEREGIGDGGKVLGRFRATGVRPQFLSTLEARGVEVGGLSFLEGEGKRSSSAPTGSGR